ncbi:MAG TPA: hypothetical protein VGL72_25020, partial [Bryobacteraceae bacterium]
MSTPTPDAEGSALLTLTTTRSPRDKMPHGEDRNNGQLTRHDSCTDIRDLKWSPAEKAIARKAFDLASGRELDAAIREAKDRAAKITQPSGLWDL